MLRKQGVYIACHEPVTRNHETVIEYGEPVECWASVYPQGDALSAQIYGLRPDDMRMLILPRYTQINEYDGVWLPGDDLAAPPPWEVTGAPVYSRHITATLKKRVMP